MDKDDLIRAVWNDTVVEENNLNQNISTLRRALGENPKDNRYIITIPGRGYRLIPAVRTRAAVATHAIRTLAVLPFKPLVAEHRDEVLEMGMADTLIARLSSSRAMIVCPLGSVRRYNGLETRPSFGGTGNSQWTPFLTAASNGMELESKNQMVRLLRVADGTSLWVQKFDQEFTDVFDVQDTIAEKVVAALALRLDYDERRKLTQRYTENVDAYHQYLLGRHHISKLTRPGIRKSIVFFQQAIDITS